MNIKSSLRGANIVKKIARISLSLLLVVIMLISVLPMSVFAATQYDLTVNGVKFTSDNLTVACGSGTAKFNPNTNTLTLNNAEINTGIRVSAISEKAFIVSNLPSLHIELIGTTVCESDHWAYQLYSSGSVTVFGSGTIETMREEYVSDGEENYGYQVVKSKTLVAVFGDLTLKDTSFYRWDTYYDYPVGGNLILNHAELIYTRMEAQGNIIIRDSAVRGEQYVGYIGYYDEYYRYISMENATGYRRSSLESKKGFTVTGSTLAQTNLRNSSYCDNVSAELNNVTMDYSNVDISGSLTAKKVKTSCTERVANSEYQFEKCTLSAEKAIKINDCNLQFTEIINGSNTKDMIEMADTTLTDSTVRAYGDLNMDFCKLYGTKVTVDGNLYCIRCIVGAEYEGQNSPITVYGEKVDIINSDFKGIAETKQGARTVYLGNGIPATQTYDYYTFSGASLCVYTDSDIGIENHTVNLTDSRLLMDRIFLEDANTVLNINETRLQLCTSTVNKDNVTITGNIQIVTGNWNASRESGIFIDFLGDYYTFDEATGELHLNNDYGVRGWFQIAQTYQGGIVPVTELTDKVKKVVVGDDVTDAQWL